LKHGEKPSRFLQWLNREWVFVEADALGIGKTKMIGYLTGLHPRIINRTSTKKKLYKTLNTTFISYSKAQKLDHSIKENNTIQEEEDEPTDIVPFSNYFRLQLVLALPHALKLRSSELNVKADAQLSYVIFC